MSGLPFTIDADATADRLRGITDSDAHATADILRGEKKRLEIRTNKSCSSKYLAEMATGRNDEEHKTCSYTCIHTHMFMPACKYAQ